MKKPFKLMTVLCLIFSIFISCSNTDELIKETSELTEAENSIIKMKELFESKNFRTINDAALYAKELVQDIKPITRAINEDDYIAKISPCALLVIEKMKNIEVNTNKSPENYRQDLKQIIEDSELSKESVEYKYLLESVDITIEVIYYAMEIEASTAVSRGFWDTAWSVVKCIGGTAGSAGLGILGGAGVGTVTLPIIGTVSGTALGGWSGALVGVATFC